MNRLIPIIVFATILCAILPLKANSISYDTIGEELHEFIYQEGGWSLSTQPWENGVTVPGWYALYVTDPSNPLATSSVPPEYRRSNGRSVSPVGLGLWRVSSSAEFGALGTRHFDSSSGPFNQGGIYIGMPIENNTGVEVTSFRLGYIGKQFHADTGGVGTFDVSYSTDADSLVTGSWTEIKALNYASPQFDVSSRFFIDDQDEAHAREIEPVTVTLDQPLPPGETIWLRWFSVNASGIDQSIGVSDVFFTGNPAPEPSPRLDIASEWQLSNTGSSQNFTLSFANASESLPLSISTPIFITGPDASFFSVIEFDEELPAASSGEITLGFNPTLIGGGERTYQINLVIETDDPNHPSITTEVNVKTYPSDADKRLRINEVLVLNQSSLEDRDGDFVPVVELYNAGELTLDTSGFTLDNGSGGAWALPQLLIAPGEFLTVFLSGKDRLGTPSALPNTIDGLVLWLDGEAIDSDPGNGQVRTQNSSLVVDQWLDQSGWGHHAIQPGVGRQPFLLENAINDRQAVDFRGMQAMFIPQMTTFSPQSEITVIVVNQLRNITGGSQTLFGDYNNSFHLHKRGSDDSLYFRAIGQDENSNPVLSPLDGIPRSFMRDGVAQITSSTLGNALLNTYQNGVLTNSNSLSVALSNAVTAAMPAFIASRDASNAPKAWNGDRSGWWDGRENHWVGVELATPKTVTNLEMWGRNGSSTIRDFKLQGSNDGERWDTLIEGEKSRNGTVQEWYVAEPAAYTHYRIFAETNHGGISTRLYDAVLYEGAENVLPVRVSDGPWDSSDNVYSIFDQVATTWYYIDSDTDFWVSVDFGAGNEVIIEQLEMRGRDGTSTMRDFRLEGSDDHSTWTEVMSGTLERDGTYQSWTFANDTAYRYYRIFGLNSHGHSAVRLHDIRLYSLVSDPVFNLNEFDDFFVGARSNTLFRTDGALGEILVFDRALSKSELSSVHNYLANKYGIVVQDDLHTDFLFAENQPLNLRETDGTLVDSFTSDRNLADVSLARVPDGEGVFVEASPSFGRSNIGSYPRPLGLMLSWQGDPTTTMTVDWHVLVDDLQFNEVNYRAAGASDWQTVTATVEEFPFSPRSILRTELTGLDPATEYEFRIGEFDRIYRFRTMPTTLDRPIRFAVGGDVHQQIGPQDMMERMNLAIMQHDPEFIVFGGDLAYADGRADRVGRWHSFFDIIYRTLITDDGFVLPLIVSIGNHELLRREGGNFYFEFDNYEQTDEWRLQYAPYFFRLFAFPGQPGYGVLDFGDYMSFLMIDSGHANPIDGIQKTWLESVLQARAGVPHIFPVYHAPAYPSVRGIDDHVAAQLREHWVPLFEQNGVKVAFENHDHAYKRTYPILNGEINKDEGVVYVGDGAWGVLTRTVDPTRWYIERTQSIRHGIVVTIQDDAPRHLMAISANNEMIDEFHIPALEDKATLYHAWLDQFGSLPATERSAMANPAGDGIVNAMKFALDLNPTAIATSGLPIPVINQTPEGDFLMLDVTLNPDLKEFDGLELVVERSTDLSQETWDPISVTKIEMIAPTLMRVRFPVADNDRMFLRLKLSGIDALEEIGTSLRSYHGSYRDQTESSAAIEISPRSMLQSK